MGNVVIKGIEVLDKTIELLGVDSREFCLDYDHYVFPLMEGEMTCDEYYRHVERLFDVKVPGKPFSDFFKPHFNKPVLEVITELHNKGQRVICASNTFEPHWSIIEREGFDRVFDKCYLSHIMGLSKPSSLFFEKILEEEGTDAGNVMFMDDSSANAGTARSMGMKVLHYTQDYDDSLLMKDFGLC